jgi:hypothetical protein
MKKILILFSFLVFFTQTYSQKIETIYLDKSDSSRSTYIILYPKIPWKGFMFLIPGMFQKPQDVLIQTNLPKYAAEQGILTVIPTFKTGISSFGVDTATQASLQEILNHITFRHKLIDKPFFIGGFSIGGTCALKYAETALSENLKIKPTAVFALDSPLDFERMYNTILREKRLSVMTNGPQEESDYMLNRFHNELGGSPQQSLANYRRFSPYSFNDTTQQAIKPLKNLPIRLYTEPDVLFALKDGIDYSGMNCFDFAALANELKRMGNTKITLIITQDKGYRNPNHERQPHSWSIVDSKDLVSWLLSQK